MLTNKVQTLRQQGYKIIIDHYRFVRCNLTGELIETPRYEIFDTSKIYPRGGTTYVEVTTPEGVTTNACAQCSLKDNYHRRLGVNIALERALAKI